MAPAMDAEACPYYHRHWGFHLSMITTWMVLRHQFYFYFALKAAEVWTLSIEHVSSTIMSTLENSVAFLQVGNAWLSPCAIQFRITFLNAAADCVDLSWFWFKSSCHCQMQCGLRA